MQISDHKSEHKRWQEADVTLHSQFFFFNAAILETIQNGE